MRQHNPDVSAPRPPGSVVRVGLLLDAAVPVLFTLPGLGLLALAPETRAWPLGLRLGAAFVLSLLLAVATQLPRRGAKALALGLALCAAASLPLLGATGAAPSLPELAAAVLTLCSYAVWAWLSRLSTYPGNLTMDLGDAPAYHRAADNLCAGRGFVEDYHIGDFCHGVYHYVTGQPVPALAIALLQRLCGPSVRSLSLLNSWAGALLCLAGAELATGGGPLTPLAALLLLAIPCHWLHLGLGAHTLVGPLCVAVLGQLVLSGLAAQGAGLAVAACCLVALFWYRPETRLWSALCVLFLACAWAWSVTGPLAHALALLAVLALGIAGWALLPAIVQRLPGSLRNMTLFYIYYHQKVKRFCWFFVHYSIINRLFAEGNAKGDNSVNPPGNANIGQEIRAHPVAFARYLGKLTADTCALMVHCLSIPPEARGPFRSWPCVVPAALLTAGALTQGATALTAASLAYLFILPIFNEGRGVRHVMLVSPLLLCLLLRLGATTLPNPPEAATAAGLALLLGAALLPLGWRSIRAVRLAPINTAYRKVAGELARVIPPGASLCCSYPQLMSQILDRPCFGSTFLAEFIEHTAATHKPDFILVDDLRGARNYTLFMERACLLLPGYWAALHDKEERWLLLRALATTPPEPTSGP